MVEQYNQNESIKIIRWLSTFSAIVCYISLIFSIIFSYTQFVVFFAVYAVVYTSISMITFVVRLPVSFVALYLAINSGVLFLTRLLGSDSPTASMFFVCIALPFFVPTLSRRMKFISSFVIPISLYYGAVFLYPRPVHPELTAVKQYAEPSLMLTLFISIWYLMYLYEKTHSQKKLIEQQLKREQIWNRQLQKAQQQVEEASQAKSKFLATLNHELRTPLHSVLGAAEVLEMSHVKGIDEELGEALRIIHQGAQKTSLKIDQILDYLDLENNSVVLNNKYVSSRIMRSHFEQLFRAVVSHKDINSPCNIDFPGAIEFFTDMDRLTRIVSPLLVNALSYCTNEVSFRAVLKKENESDGVLLLTVADDGKGLSKEAKKHLFEAFTPGDQSYSREKGGLGLGLTTVQKSLTLMNGTIEIDDWSSSGTIIKVGLPVHFRPAQFPDVVVKSVLVVDDTPANRKILELFVKKLGCAVECAQDGIEAVNMVEQKYDNYRSQYDIILMDLQMPQMDGFCATCKIRDLERRWKIEGSIIYAVSANSSSEDRKRAMEMGMDGFFAKPVHMDELKELIMS